MRKECEKCHRKVAIARKVCDCGHVFKEKKKLGFKEMPVVLTPDRLRHVARPAPRRRSHASDSDVDSSSNASSNPNNSILSMSKELLQQEKLQKETANSTLVKETSGHNGFKNNANVLSNMVEKIIVDSETSDKNKNTEKLYPRREKNTKHECLNVASIIKKYIPDQELTKTKDKANSNKTIQHEAEMIEKKKHVQEEVDTSNKQCDARHASMSIKNSQNSKDFDAICVLPKENENVLTDDFDRVIDILLLDCDAVQSGFNQKSFEGDQTFEFYRRPKVRRITYKEDKDSDDLPLSKLKKLKSPNLEGKRPVGRPRKHPPKEILPKRPVGRPRKHSVKIESHIGRCSSSETHDFPTMVAIKGNEELLASPMSQQPRRRGRPKGAKDSKPRKARQDFIERVVYNNVKGDIEREDLHAVQLNMDRKTGRCFLSPPSLMASAKRERIRNEMLETVENERLRSKLNKTTAFVIPEDKKELYSLILDEINRRIAAQSFNVLS